MVWGGVTHSWLVKTRFGTEQMEVMSVCVWPLLPPSQRIYINEGETGLKLFKKQNVNMIGFICILERILYHSLNSVSDLGPQNLTFSINWLSKPIRESLVTSKIFQMHGQSVKIKYTLCYILICPQRHSASRIMEQHHNSALKALQPNYVRLLHTNLK